MKYAILLMCCMGVVRGSGVADPDVIIDVDPPYVTVPTRFGVLGNGLLNRYTDYHSLDLYEYPNQTLKVQNRESFIKIYVKYNDTLKSVSYFLQDIEIKDEGVQEFGPAIERFCHVFGLDKGLMVDLIIQYQQSHNLPVNILLIKAIVQCIEVSNNPLDPGTIGLDSYLFHFSNFGYIFINRTVIHSRYKYTAKIIQEYKLEPEKTEDFADLLKKTIVQIYDIDAFNALKASLPEKNPLKKKLENSKFRH